MKINQFHILPEYINIDDPISFPIIIGNGSVDFIMEYDLSAFDDLFNKINEK